MRTIIRFKTTFWNSSLHQYNCEVNVNEIAEKFTEVVDKEDVIVKNVDIIELHHYFTPDGIVALTNYITSIGVWKNVDSMFINLDDEEDIS